MSSIEIFALVVIGIAGLYLLALGAASLFMPARASRFLLGFAGSQPVHFLELAVRLVVGASLIVYAPRVAFSRAFSLFGWVLLGSTACLLLLPWRWHRRFAQDAVPRATRHIALVGLASLALGGLLLAGVAMGWRR